MTPQTLIDVQAANLEARECLKKAAAQMAAEACGAHSVNSFLNAVTLYQDAVAELDRKGRCRACSRALVAETVCVHCGRDNQ